MSEGTRIREALPDRSLSVSEAEALVDSSGEDTVLPAAVLTGGSGDNDAVCLLVETSETAYAIGFDPAEDAWVVFETWEGGEAFDRGKTDGRVREWVTDHYEGAADDEIWNPSA